MVVSTQCQGCRANFQVQDGKAVVRPRPTARLAPPRRDSDPFPEPPPQQAKSPFQGPPAVPAPRHPIFRFFFPSKPPREISCFDCGHHYTAAAEAQSSQCPRCSCYVSLLDYAINQPWNRRIQTRGNVTILKSGAVSGGTIQCHHLTVLGELGSSVDCSGDLIIRGHGKVMGTVNCRQLRIQRGARVEFFHPVTAASANIDGYARGQIFCTGIITLGKRARLQGFVRASAIVVKSGAKHSGTLEIVQADTTPNPEEKNL
ncbi:MAG: polymer-forming cytoskeletal protein [Verrucomicrobia bacterium]|nr:polymer-forming cytoskeletal protein [Verrucomicrobiota bacterium]